LLCTHAIAYLLYVGYPVADAAVNLAVGRTACLDLLKEFCFRQQQVISGTLQKVGKIVWGVDKFQ
jgi:hypothetical protein